MDDYKAISSFDADERLAPFKKDAQEEEWLSLINHQLLPIQETLEQIVEKSIFPIILILGVPRAGTTLLSQLLASRLNVGYISNLIARFYETPAVGAILHKILLGNRYHQFREYDSRHGVTKNIEEPHEFGYFWARHLGVCGEVHQPTESELEKVNIKRMDRELQSIARVLGKPLVLKCVLGDFFIPVLKNLPHVFFIDIQRDQCRNAMSIWRVRQQRLGSVEKWWSLRPRNYQQLCSLPADEQIVQQIGIIRRVIDQEFAEIPDCRKWIVSYEGLCEKPEESVEEFLLHMLQWEQPLEKVGEVLKPLASGSENTDHASLRKWQRLFNQ